MVRDSDSVVAVQVTIILERDEKQALSQMECYGLGKEDTEDYRKCPFSQSSKTAFSNLFIFTFCLTSCSRQPADEGN